LRVGRSVLNKHREEGRATEKGVKATKLNEGAGKTGCGGNIKRARIESACWGKKPDGVVERASEKEEKKSAY